MDDGLAIKDEEYELSPISNFLLSFHTNMIDDL